MRWPPKGSLIPPQPHIFLESNIKIDVRVLKYTRDRGQLWGLRGCRCSKGGGTFIWMVYLIRRRLLVNKFHNLYNQFILFEKLGLQLDG